MLSNFKQDRERQSAAWNSLIQAGETISSSCNISYSLNNGAITMLSKQERQTATIEVNKILEIMDITNQTTDLDYRANSKKTLNIK